MRKFGGFLMGLGVVLILGALALFLYNRYEQDRAEQASAAVIPKLQAAISSGSADKDTTDPTGPAATEPVSRDMKEVEIDGYGYIGYLSIPVLNLELPIMSQWDYQRLRIAPCRFMGTVDEDNLAIAGHNYVRHFGPIRRLTAGDRVTFTDVDGVVTVYEVAVVDVLAPTAVEEVTTSGFDLTLFTCTYGGENRITVFCNQA